MTKFSLVILYVADVGRSAAFYSRLLGAAPLEQSATFTMFALPAGAALGLWRREAVEPSAGSPTGGSATGGSEIAFQSDDVDATFALWSGHGVTILQTPTDMDFGRTFVAADPSGHRLRVFKPG